MDEDEGENGLTTTTGQEISHFLFCGCFKPEDCCISGTKTVPEGESPGGFIIEIYKEGENEPYTTVETKDDGSWSVCLPYGTYTVKEAPTTGWVIDPTVYPVTLTGTGGEEDDCGRDDLDFENEPAECCIGGTKTDPTGKGLAGWVIYVDVNGNGEFDDGEPSDTTDNQGRWTICGLENLDGEYEVLEVPQDGWTQISPTEPYTVELPDDCGEDDLDFVNEREECCISGTKRDSTGAGLEGWTIYVDLNENAKFDDGEPSATTDSTGRWSICGLGPGTYQVREVHQIGWVQTLPTTPHEYFEVTLPDPDCGKTGLDFVNQRECCISGHKYDNLENPLDGWTINVKDGQGNIIRTVVTGTGDWEDGYWEVCDLPDGTYTVCEVVKDGWTQVSPTDCYTVTLPGDCGTDDLDFVNDPVEEGGLTVKKKADKDCVERCGNITYTITVCNEGNEDIKNVVVWDVFDKNVEILSTTFSMPPTLVTDGKWQWTVLPRGECVEITLKVKVPERQDFEFGFEQGVKGEGFVKVANDYRTALEAYIIKNCVYVTSDWNPKPISDCVCVTVGRELGTELQTREYGSGLFESEEKVSLLTDNSSIEWAEDVSATYNPTTIALYHNRSVVYDSKWVKKARAKNWITGTTMTETYHDAVALDRESSMKLNDTESMMVVDSEFDGRGHIGFLKMPENATRQSTPIFELREDYVGSFKVLQRVDEYGSSVSSEKAASGTGLVVGDRRIGSSQRSYESGTGTYDSEEVIETYTNYIAKDISLTYAPINQSLTEDFSIEASSKWKEGIYSKNPGTSYIGEEYTSIEYLDKETVAKGLNEMNTKASFEGQARYRAILSNLSSNGTAEPSIDFDEQYTGDYSIERRILFTGVAKYDRPHLNVTKTLDGIVEEKDECDEENCSKTMKIATYTITIENDGNAALGPVYVTDFFPPGAAFVESSLRPSELGECCYANWTLTHLSIGDVRTIILKLDVTKYHPDELVNRVEVCGGYNGDWVCAKNFSAMEINWLTCCIVPREEQIYVIKTGEVDEENQSVVRYLIEITNRENVTRVATVTDHLPEGMTFLDSSTPIASYDGADVVWNLIEIEPFETVAIEFSAHASAAGRYINAVEVDPRSVDGPVVQPVGAVCVVDVGDLEDCGKTSCSIWSPPNWDLLHYGYEPDDLTCEQLTCTECNGTESCLAP